MSEIMQYVTRESAFHRLHPLTKLIFAVVVVALAVLTSDTVMLAALAGAVVAVAIASGLARDLLRQVPLLISLAVSLLALTIITIRSGEIICYLVPPSVPVIGGAFPVTVGAIDLALAMSLRFAAMLFAFQLLVISTQPRDLVHVMDRLRMPVDYTLMFLIALRFIPSLQLEGKRIHEAQLARAYNPGKGLAGKIRGLFPIIIPLVSNSLGKATVLGLTIDLRGYRSGRRTPMRDLSPSRTDVAGICCMGLLVAGYFAVLLV
ncbi:energy-coupling factor transporter transmembrane protein EcfT [Methanoculleus sp. YWC-01]|uniref:Energy-coupling factor transporter transmembrane protein EcfT n=1 Tax=Methanoculleus nereidis TaxID=2735141 RepID=A0ABU3Z0Q5_9EURY|nr:energy-coupling factor transporter transmembrane protein EcfT [Methanoculleus sp. YWC-01]MCK9297755.1 energy-coupling factor transporter transmembrane protein EcfT [Methanoculleus sp.]MDV4342361.1 energy-coupling factor transporter transmembrane protein EcfT [Methanoculleus sp. YWC-01]